MENKIWYDAVYRYSGRTGEGMNKSRLFYAAVYIRLSREDGDKEESDSVGNQRKLLTGYVSKMENVIIYDIYVDDGYTGTSFVEVR